MKPMLAKTGGAPDLKRGGFIFEPKLDGYRAIARIGEGLTLTSRNGLDITGKFPGLDFSTVRAKQCALDGEIIAYDGAGNPDFDLLASGGSPVYVAFDILEKDGADLRRLPLTRRKAVLEEAVKENPTLQRIAYTADGERLWRMLKRRRIEGVVAKKADAAYVDGIRSDAWLKIKAVNSAECAIIGYTQKKRKISSLALGLYEGGRIVPVGKVASGLSDRLIEGLKPKLVRLETGNTAAGVRYVKPRYVAEVEYLKITSGRKLRAPVFKRLRSDKTPRQCTFEQFGHDLNGETNREKTG
jgi:bifunctional non-homologous end joining protein LigD